jgi:hypothetical protein
MQLGFWKGFVGFGFALDGIIFSTRCENYIRVTKLI